MSLKVYKNFSDSQNPYINMLPSHWVESKLGYLFTLGKGLTITKQNLQEAGIPCINYGEVHSKFGFEFNPSVQKLKSVSSKYLKTDPNALLNKGDFVFADTSEDIAGSGNFSQLTSNDKAFAGYHTIIVRPSKPLSSRYFAYLFDSEEFRNQIRTHVKGVKVFSISQGILKSAVVWLPTFPEQLKIAQFLDYETAKIDGLIDEQQRLIELLKEKRQAVISHAVTKGLNPDAPMKDSRVEWLGKIPEHWTCVSLKYTTDDIEQGWSPQCYGYETREGKWGVLKSGAVNGGLYLDSENKELPESLTPRPEIEVKLGDILMSRASGSRELIGSAGYVESTKPRLMISDKLFRLKYSNQVDPQFLVRTLGSVPLRRQIELCIGGAEGLANNLSQANIKNLKLAVPPIKEQTEISTELNRQLLSISALIDEATTFSDLLKERRSALISAAVTGKIDVRDWQPPQGSDTVDKKESAQTEMQHG